MILRIPLLPETVGKVEDLPAKLKFLAPAVRKLGTSELEDAELAARFPEKDDRDGFLLCRRAFREKVSDLGGGLAIGGAPNWERIVQEACREAHGAMLHRGALKFQPLSIPEHLAQMAHGVAAGRMGEAATPLEDYLRGTVAEETARRAQAALQEGVRRYRAWAEAVEGWDGVSKLSGLWTLPVPAPPDGATPANRWTAEKVIGAWIDAWVNALVLPEVRLLKDPLAVLVDGRIVLWVSLYFRNTRANGRQEWTSAQEKWIRGKLRENRLLSIVA